MKIDGFEEKRLVSYIKENDKKIYHGSDIREAMNDILKLRTEVHRLTNRINAILALGGPDNDN